MYILNVLSSLQQIALFVTPFIVTLGWIIGHPITMFFDSFESIVLFSSVFAVRYVVQDRKPDWFEGMIFICLYVPISHFFLFFLFGAEAGHIGTQIRYYGIGVLVLPRDGARGTPRLLGMKGLIDFSVPLAT